MLSIPRFQRSQLALGAIQDFELRKLTLQPQLPLLLTPTAQEHVEHSKILKHPQLLGWHAALKHSMV